jgi:Phytanoyl-CoA dioxygenase (PhyH)
VNTPQGSTSNRQKLDSGMTALLDSTPILANADALRERAREDGYLFFRALMGPERPARLRELVVDTVAELGFVQPGYRDRFEVRVRPGAALTGTGYDDPRWLTLQQRVLPDARFTDVGDDPGVLAVLAALFGEPPMTRRGDICRLVLPGASHQTTPPHQDHYYTGGTPDLWTAWFPLLETPLELGPLALFPGSHSAGLLPHEGEGAGRQGVLLPEGVSLAVSPVSPGDAILFNCLTVHCALSNLTADRVRLSADFRYQPASEPIHVIRVDGSSARG